MRVASQIFQRRPRLHAQIDRQEDEDTDLRDRPCVQLVRPI